MTRAENEKKAPIGELLEPTRRHYQYRAHKLRAEAAELLATAAAYESDVGLIAAIQQTTDPEKADKMLEAMLHGRRGR